MNRPGTPKRNAPLLQVALDLENLPEAVRIARLVEPEADILEVGGQLLKFEGVRVLRRLRGEFPHKVLLADTKTMDMGEAEALMVFDAGADIMTVCGAAPDETVLSAISLAHELGKKVMVDLIGVRFKLNRATELAGMSPDFLCVLKGVEEREGETGLPRELELITAHVKIPLAVAGGITPQALPKIMVYRPAVVIVGRYIVRARDPALAAREVRDSLAELAKG